MLNMKKRTIYEKHSDVLMRLKKLSIPRPNILRKYLTHKEINQFLDYIERRFPHFVIVHTIGLSYEGRELRAIEIDWHLSENQSALQSNSIISTYKEISKWNGGLIYPEEAPTQTRPRNMVLIEGGTHAREWLTISVALQCIYQLTERNSRNREVLDKVRFFIVPVVNPDGYEYSLQKNRRWRKNRRPLDDSPYIGTDCNRNYDIHWENGSNSKRRSTYRGETPFSETETCALQKILQRLSSQLVLLISLHSCAQSIMYPWGYSTERPKRWQDLDYIASVGRSAIRNYNGRNYRTGSIADLTRHLISGSIVDYAFGVMKVPYALVMELPGIEFGFQPPLDAISTLGEESWRGIQAMATAATQKHQEKNVVTPRKIKKNITSKVSHVKSNGLDRRNVGDSWNRSIKVRN